MKHYFAGLIALLFLSSASAQQLSIDATLGSLVGENGTGYGAVMPFHAAVELSTEVKGVEVGFIPIGHQSTADRNGNEYNGEYYGLFANKSIGQFYGKAKIFQFYNNNDEPEGNTATLIEVGVNSGLPFRLGVWYQESENYQAQGVNAGFNFDLWGL